MAKTYYQWRMVEGVEGVTPRGVSDIGVENLVTPLLFMFDTPELALQGLDDFKVREEAESKPWVLVKITEELLTEQPFNS